MKLRHVFIPDANGHPVTREQIKDAADSLSSGFESQEVVALRKKSCGLPDSGGEPCANLVSIAGGLHRCKGCGCWVPVEAFIKLRRKKCPKGMPGFD